MDYERSAFRSTISTAYCSLPVIGDTYRNCQNGCLYCYERQANNQHLRNPDITPHDFRSLFNSLYEVPWIKEWVINRRLPVRIGVVGEPFPALEREARATFRLLQLLSRAGIAVQLTTKRPTEIDADHIRVLKECPKAMVRVSFSTLDDEKAKILEPGAPSPSDRLVHLERLSQNGIEVGIRLAPFLPTENYDYDLLAETGASNLTVELFRWSALWRHSSDPALWGVLCDMPVPAHTERDLKNKKSFIRQWVTQREKAYFEPLQDPAEPYYSPSNLWITSNIFKLRELWGKVRDEAHRVGLHFAICSTGVGIHNIDLNDAPCGCITEGWNYETGALVPAWHKNQWADYLIPEIAEQPYDAYLERIILANSHSYRPIALDQKIDHFRVAIHDEEQTSEDPGSVRGRY